MQTKTKSLVAVAFCGVLLGLFNLIHYSGSWRQSRLNNQLLEAVQSRQGDYAIRKLIQEGANPNAVGANEYDTVLFRAIQLGSVSTVQTLLANGASVHPIGEAHIGPAISLACYQPVNAENHPDWSVTDYVALFKDFQRHGESIEERDVLGDTPLMRAVWSGNVEATEALLKLGANGQAVNNSHQTVWDWTSRYPSKQDQLRNLLHKKP